MKKSFIKYFNFLPFLCLFVFIACDHQEREKNQQPETVKVQPQDAPNEASVQLLPDSENGMMVN